MVQEKTSKVPLSEGYLVADSKKCAGYIACMLACSLVHDGKTSPSLSRIQIVQDTWECFPGDINLAICRQCVSLECVEGCPTGALYVDEANVNIRRVDESLCNGCQVCVDAFPYKPSRVIWNPDKNITTKCDLCLKAPYWREKGGPYGQQACVEVCPMRATKLVREVPEEATGYEVNLRNEHWGWLGFSTD